MKRSIALDANMLLYSVQVSQPSDATNVVAWKRDIRALLARTDIDFIIPTPAFGEFLSNFEDAKYQAVSSEYEKSFEIIPYNLSAAWWASRFWRRFKQTKIAPKDRTRAALKLDVEILACAVAVGAHGLCTADSDLTRLSTGYDLGGLIIAEPSAFLA